MAFDSKLGWLKGPDFFPRFDPTQAPEPLAPLGLAAQTELLVVELPGAPLRLLGTPSTGPSHAYLSPQLAYHHCAQAVLEDQPYVLSY